MARINVEDKLYTDVRFEKLCENLGDKHTAIGLMVDAWRTAQRYWVNDKELVPFKIWELGGLKFQKLIEFCLAEIRDSGVYVSGSEEQFDWLLQKKEAGNKSAKSRKEKFGTAQPNTNTVRTGAEHRSDSVGTEHEHTSNAVLIPLEQAPNGPEPLTLAPSLALSQNANTLPTEAGGACVSKKRVRESKPLMPNNEAYIALGQMWLDHAVRVTQANKVPKNWTCEIFGFHIEKAALQFGYEINHVKKMIQFMTESPTWKKNYFHPEELWKFHKITKLAANVEKPREVVITAPGDWGG